MDVAVLIVNGRAQLSFTKKPGSSDFATRCEGREGQHIKPLLLHLGQLVWALSGYEGLRNECCQVDASDIPRVELDVVWMIRLDSGELQVEVNRGRARVSIVSGVAPRASSIVQLIKLITVFMRGSGLEAPVVIKHIGTVRDTLHMK
jgi:hypothetical protein